MLSGAVTTAACRKFDRPAIAVRRSRMGRDPPLATVTRRGSARASRMGGGSGHSASPLERQRGAKVSRSAEGRSASEADGEARGPLGCGWEAGVSPMPVGRTGLRRRAQNLSTRVRPSPTRSPVIRRLGPLAAGHVHMARHRWKSARPVDDEVMPLGLAGDGFADRRVEKFVAFRGAQRRAQIGRVFVA